MQHPALRQQDALFRRVFDLPGLAPVQAAREQMRFGFLAVYVVTLRPQVFILPRAEPDQNLVAPRPDAVIGGPPAKATGPIVDFDVLDSPVSLLDKPSHFARRMNSRLPKRCLNCD